MRRPEITLDLPAHLSPEHRRLVLEVASRNDAEHGEALLGLVLSGSAGRGLATERSDVDVYVVLADEAVGERATSHAAAVDEIPLALSELLAVPTFGSDGWWYRWSFAWAPVLVDRTAGRIPKAVQRQAAVTDDEAVTILVEHDRLDGWVNYAFRALKNDRDGRTLERRLDAAESMPWLLDVIFSLAGRVRPYHKYLPWELRRHPLPDWDADDLLGLLTATLDGDPGALRATFLRVERLCRAFDEHRPDAGLTRILESWGDQLELLRG